MVLQWMKRMEKQPMTEEENQSPENSSVTPNSSTPSPHSHVAGQSSTPIPPNRVTSHHPQEFARPFQVHNALHMTKEVKLPTFSGTDRRGWLTRAETCFHILDIPKHLHVSLAHICMEGVAVHWFSILRKSQDPLS